MFQHVDIYPGDPILSLVDTFKKDPRSHKVNLGIGIYYDEAGLIPVLGSVQKAESEIAQTVTPRPYLPMEGARFIVKRCRNCFGALIMQH